MTHVATAPSPSAAHHATRTGAGTPTSLAAAPVATTPVDTGPSMVQVTNPGAATTHTKPAMVPAAASHATRTGTAIVVNRHPLIHIPPIRVAPAQVPCALQVPGNPEVRTLAVQSPVKPIGNLSRSSQII